MPGLPAAFIREVSFISEYQSKQRLIIAQIAKNKVTVSGQPFFRWMPLSMSSTGVTKTPKNFAEEEAGGM